MDDSREDGPVVTLTLTTKKPHPLYELSITNKSGRVGLSIHRYAALKDFRDVIINDLKSVSFLEFPVRYTKSKLGIRLNEDELLERTSMLQKWFLHFFKNVNEDDLSSSSRKMMNSMFFETLERTEEASGDTKTSVKKRATTPGNLPELTEGAQASEVVIGRENRRRRGVFDTLVKATSEQNLKATRGNRTFASNQVVNWLRKRGDLDFLAELWIVLGMDGPLPLTTEAALIAIQEFFSEMGESVEGQVHYELFSRYISRSQQKAAEESDQLDQEAEAVPFTGNVVGLDASQVANDAKVVVVELREISDLEGRKNDAVDPYIEMNLMCPNTERKHGKQFKKSQQYGKTKNLLFSPPLFYGFAVDADTSKAKVTLTVWDKNSISADTEIGFTVVYLKHLKNPSTEEIITLALSDPETGNKLKTKVLLGIKVVSKDDGFGFGVEHVYEYQRYRAECDIPWGNDIDHLLPTDPGKWSTTGKNVRFKWSLDEASSILPPGWTATTWSCSNSFGDHGWQYAPSFKMSMWTNEQSAFAFIRRRLWYRCLQAPTRPALALASDAVADAVCDAAAAAAEDNGMSAVGLEAEES